MNKKQLIALHSLVGLKLSVLMFIVSLTGTLAVLSYELDWLLDSDMRVSSQATDINWDGMVESVHAAYPERQLLFIAAPLYSNFASVAFTLDPELGARRTLLNPYSGELISDSDWYASAQRVLRDLHRYLLSPVGGIYLVGPLAIILLVSVITALLFYRKWWRGFFKLRLNNGARAFWGSFHKVSGLWSLWFVLLMAITGVWYLAEAIVADLGIDIQFDRPRVSEQQLNHYDFMETPLTASAAVAIAKQQIDGLEVKSISLPRNQQAPYYIVGQTDALLVRNRSNHVFIDPVTGDVLRKQETHEKTAFQRWIDMADPLHFGNFGGLSVKFIWFGFGVLICGLTATGIVIFVKRIKNRSDAGLVHAVLGNFKYITALILLIPITMATIKVLDNYGLLERVTANSAQVYQGDGFQVRLSFAPQPDENAVFVRYSLLCQACLPNAHQAQLVLSSGEVLPFKQHENGFRSTSEVSVTHAQINQIAAIQFELLNGKTVVVPAVQ
ncbi:MAG: PepSY-associated TM helix domain-containing protein [Idiomarina sp.]